MALVGMHSVNIHRLVWGGKRREKGCERREERRGGLL
jgi:hypothetical protein